MQRLDLTFPSRGGSCSAWLYLPQGVPRPPVVVMAHGITAQKDFGLQQYAEYFCAKGLAALVFDYRNFGESTGEPRNLVNPWRHIQDWKAAIARVRTLEEVDGNRIALWGTSFSGGHVLVCAAGEKDIRAVVSQVPFVDGIATTIRYPPAFIIRGLVHGLRDLARMLGGRPPHTIPALAQPGSFAIMNTPDVWQWYHAFVPEDTTWRNAVPARILLMIPAYRPLMYARRITCPVLIMYAREDPLCPREAVERAGRRIPHASVIGFPGGHFAVYQGELFRQMVRRQAEFLAQHLCA